MDDLPKKTKLSHLSQIEKYIHQRTIDKVVKQRYYETRGRVLQTISRRSKRYGIEKDYFKECISVEDVNNKVNDFLRDKGLPLTLQKPTKEYKEHNKRRDIKLTRFED